MVLGKRLDWSHRWRNRKFGFVGIWWGRFWRQLRGGRWIWWWRFQWILVKQVEMNSSTDKTNGEGCTHRPTRHIQRMVYWLLLAMLSFNFANAQREIPELWGSHVHDEARILKQPTVDDLERKLVAHQDSTSNEIGILIISSLQGDALEDYSLRVVEKWKLGKKAKANLCRFNRI